MDERELKEYRKMVIEYQKRDDPTGWFENIYSRAGGDHTAVFWADLAPNPYLIDWLGKHPVVESQNQTRHKAIAIGCGVGDDSEVMSEYGYDVTAFDISNSAIDLCKNRYPQTKVEYLVADLFDYPEDWFQAFDLVYECNTIQVLPGKYRKMARESIASLVASGGDVLVSCRSRNPGELEDAIPLPLDRDEMDGFIRSGLIEKGFEAYDDEQNPPVPHFFAWYQRPTE